MHQHMPANGLFPIYINPSSGQATSRQITFGALGDSFYEYLLKTWLQGGQKESMYREMYDKAMDGMDSLLLKTTTPSHLKYVADYDGSRTVDKMDHLVCFVPGMLALGAYTSDGTAGASNKWRDLKNAKAIMYVGVAIMCCGRRALQACSGPHLSRRRDRRSVGPASCRPI